MEENNDDLQMPLAPTLQALKAYGNKLKVPLPQNSLICSRCPKSLWHATSNEVRCFCRVMMVMTWTSDQLGDMTLCDGAVEKDDKR